MPSNTQVFVEPFRENPIDQIHLRDSILHTAAVRDYFGDINPEQLRFTEPDTLDRGKAGKSPIRVEVFHPETNRGMTIQTRFETLDQIEAEPSLVKPLPFPDEVERAVALLRVDERFHPLALRQDVVVYQPMPPLHDVEQEDGSSIRRITLGIYDPEGEFRHQFVAISLTHQTVEWHPQGLDPSHDNCEAHLPARIDSAQSQDGLDKVRVRVIRDGQELWNFIVVRPRASAPSSGKGSGVELRYVRYRGRLVLWQAHVPILNVVYEDQLSYRDWQNSETKFQAVGNDPVGPGWRVCTVPPATILESGDDTGDFQGVAFHYDDGELRVVSELQAGWYRYISDWRFGDDGVIKPRFGFAGTSNPRTCMPHQHHTYWRLDFDIDGAGNDVIEQSRRAAAGGKRWVALKDETRRKRSPLESWRIMDAPTQCGYRIVPGVADGTADAYGVGDMWFLRYRATELEDGVTGVTLPPSGSMIQIDKYVNGESIEQTDVVVWYAGHFMHDEHAPHTTQGHIVGPELRPVNW